MTNLARHGGGARRRAAHDPDKAITADDRARLKGKKLIVSLSGGKDSSAACLLLQHHKIKFEAVFMDTGWEHPDTYEYIRQVLEPRFGPIRWLKAEKQMQDLIRHKGMFPARVIRFCTQELKLKPFEKYLQSLKIPTANAVGIRAAESRARSELPRWSVEDGWQIFFDVWRPLIDWTEDDVIAIHREFELAPNPMYLRGTSRVGCWPCIFARKREIRLVSELTPERIEEIRQLEAEVTDAAAKRYAKTNETFESKGYAPPSFFSLKRKGKTTCTPIDDIVAWSKTKHGGRELDPTPANDPSAGCMRWGFCEMQQTESTKKSPDLIIKYETTKKKAQRVAFDSYATPTACVQALLDAHPPPTDWVWDIGAGSGSITNALVEAGHIVQAIEIQPDFRGQLEEAGADSIIIGDWLKESTQQLIKPAVEPFSIVANPPFRDDAAFVEAALKLEPRFVAMLLKVSFFSSKRRVALHQRWPVTNFYPLVPRPSFTANGKTDPNDVAWFVWDFSQKPMPYRVLNWKKNGRS